MMKIRLVLLLMLFLFAKAFANECTCEMEEIIDENADAINIAISKYKDIVYKRHKFDKSRYEVFVTPTFYPQYIKRRSLDIQLYFQDVYAFNYCMVDRTDSIMYISNAGLWYKGISPGDNNKLQTCKTYAGELFDEQFEYSKKSIKLYFLLSFLNGHYYVFKSSEFGLYILPVDDVDNRTDICDTWKEAQYFLSKRGLKEMLICHLHTESVKKFIARMDSVMGKTSFDNTMGSMALKFKPCRSKKLTDKFLENLNVEHPVLIRHNEYDAFIDSIKPEYSFYIYGDKDFSLFYVKNKKLRVLCHPDRGDKSVVKDFSYEAYYQTFVGKTRF